MQLLKVFGKFLWLLFSQELLKVNATACTQILIDGALTHVINTGAGLLSPELQSRGYCYLF